MTESTTLVLTNLYHWEATSPHTVYMTQPVGGGELKDYTWAQTADQVRRMAAHLRSLNLPPKSNIGLISKNCAHWIMADLAIWMAGHVSVPLYPTLMGEHVRQILEHSESKLLFVGKLDNWDMVRAGIPETLPQIALPISPPLSAPKWEQIVAETPPMTENPEREPGELASIMYTSGSTGTPKGVMMSFEAMALPGHEIRGLYGITPNDRMLSYLPLAHTFERMVVETVSLIAGMHIYFAESLDTFLEDLKRAHPTIFVSVPRLWVKFQLGVFEKMPQEKLSRLLSIPLLSRIVRRKVLQGLGLHDVRLAVSGAAPIPPEVIDWYRRLGLELSEGYGMSENFSYSHGTRPGESRVGYVGTPQPGVQARISAHGEIEVKSPADMLGYFKAPELTRATFTDDGFVKTGDMGEIDAQGRLRITGRLKELFKTSKGKYVAPAPIENKLLNHPFVEQACVCGEGQPKPYALIMLSEEAMRRAKENGGQAALQRALEQHLQAVNAALDPHEQLAFIAVVRDQWLTENGFLTPTMKIRRSVVEQTYTPFEEGWYKQGRPVIWQ
ncbi:MAG: AMP-binding protein [Candidatus Lambdaproteobacteria bacterium]|nr:AMP-binding protein [Candidatus Lambdaproteobacteria bacterium]